MSTDTLQEKRMEKAKIWLVIHEPFFASLALQMPISQEPGIPTACTDGKRMLYNPAFTATLNDGQLRFLLVHELWHVALLHPWRFGDRNRKKANVAADYVVNNWIDNYNQEMAKSHRPVPFELAPGCLLDHSWGDLSFEEIYAKIPDPPEGQDGHSGGVGDFTSASQDAAEQTALQEQWRVNVKQAEAALKEEMAGNVPQTLQRLIGQALASKVDWPEVVKRWFTDRSKDDYSWSRPNRRYAHRGFILPSLYSNSMGAVAIICDSSGSVTQGQFDVFISNVEGFMLDCRPSSLTVIISDAAVHSVDRFLPGEPIKIEIRGGGGTDFGPALAELEKLEDEPVCCVYLTDLYGSFPDKEPICPVLWAVIGSNKSEPPFGERVEVEL